MILDLHIAVKPLSANKMSGRNKSYLTPEYKAYQQEKPASTWKDTGLSLKGHSIPSNSSLISC